MRCIKCGSESDSFQCQCCGFNAFIEEYYFLGNNNSRLIQELLERHDCLADTISRRDSAEMNFTREDLIDMGKAFVPVSIYGFWIEEVNKNDLDEMNWIARILHLFSTGERERAIGILKRDGIIDDGLILGSVATFHPDGVNLVREALIDTYGEISEHNKEILSKIEEYYRRKDNKEEEGSSFYSTDQADFSALSEDEQNEIIDEILKSMA